MVFLPELWQQRHMGQNCMSTVCVSILLCLMGTQLYYSPFQHAASFSNKANKQQISVSIIIVTVLMREIGVGHVEVKSLIHMATGLSYFIKFQYSSVCSRNTANKSITEGWGQRKEIGFCQACCQVLNLEYLSHTKSTFIVCKTLPLLLSPLEALSGCVECVSMKEVLRGPV